MVNCWGFVGGLGDAVPASVFLFATEGTACRWFVQIKFARAKRRLDPRQQERVATFRA